MVCRRGLENFARPLVSRYEWWMRETGLGMFGGVETGRLRPAVLRHAIAPAVLGSASQFGLMARILSIYPVGWTLS